jgi:hypothetical protein
MSDIAEAASETNNTMTLLLACIAGVSLLVGGIGIMNIMLVSVTERTREIGIRMAIGARSSAVRSQFLIEAVVLSLIGGVLGIVLGIGVSLAIPAMLGWPTLISTMAIVGSAIFSVIVGVFFGYYPARKAAALIRSRRCDTNSSDVSADAVSHRSHRTHRTHGTSDLICGFPVQVKIRVGLVPRVNRCGNLTSIQVEEKTSRSFSHRLWRYGPPVIWATLILIGSSDLLSASHTSTFLVSLCIFSRRERMYQQEFIRLSQARSSAERNPRDAGRARFVTRRVSFYGHAGSGSRSCWPQLFPSATNSGKALSRRAPPRSMTA